MPTSTHTYARARHGVQCRIEKQSMFFKEGIRCDATAPAVKPAPGAARLARPKAVAVVAAADCMVGPAQARRPRGSDAYLSFRGLAGRGSPGNAPGEVDELK